MKKAMVILMGAAAMSLTQAAGPQAPPALSDLAWLAGSWAGRAGDLEMEEHWTSPRGGSMLSVHRDVKGGATVSFEFARIEQKPDGLYFLASPGGAPATPFRLEKMEGRRVVFENTEHDFPQRVIYWLHPDGSLGARIEGMQDGKPASMEWRWSPASLK